MLMLDQPLAVNLAEADGRAHPHVDFIAVGHRAADPVEIMAEGHAVARLDSQVANLVADWALIPGEPLPGAFSYLLCSDILQRVQGVERQNIRRMVCHQLIAVSVVDGLDPLIY